MIKNILIVDDEPHLTESFKVLFEARGVFVQTASNGRDAIDIFKKTPFKIVLSDIQMDEMDGIQLMKNLKKIDPLVQVVFLTGYASVENAANAFKQGNAFDYLKKPVKNFNFLYETLEQAENRYDVLKEDIRKEKEKEESFAVFKSIFDCMEALVYVSDMDTHDFLYVNKKFMETFGNGDRQFLEGKKCWQVIQKDQTGPCPFCTNKRLIHEDGKPGDPYEWEFCNTKNHHWYSIVDKAVEWYDKRIVRLETAFDITEKKEQEKLYRQFEKAIETSRKLESIGTLAGGVAHDFNNTLSTIVGNINLAQLSCFDSESKKFLQKAETGVLQAKKISSKLITFARGRGPHKTLTHVADLVRQTLEMKLGPQKIPYTFDFDEIPGNFFADQEQLKTAIGNILENSIESMESLVKDGRIDVSIRYRKQTSQTPCICISISDSGSGISREHLDLIFNPYFTTKPFSNRKSTGLGLSIAWSFITRHGGNIQVESVKDQGTTVHIFLPVFSMETAGKGSARTPLLPAEPPDSVTLARVLVMDDDGLTLDVIARLLKHLGYEVLIASTGFEAIEICSEARDKHQKIDVALLDYDIIGGLGGFQTMAELRKIDPCIIGILITGHTDHTEIKKYQNYGFSALLEKPFSMTQLRDKMSRLGR